MTNKREAIEIKRIYLPLIIILILLLVNGIYSASKDQDRAVNQNLTNTSRTTLQMNLTYDHQDTSYNCGPSSLKMALSVYGLDLNETWLAQAAKTSSKGTYQQDLVGAISSVNSVYGTNLFARSESFNGWDTLNSYVDADVPVILYVRSWNNLKGGHYVVLMDVDEQNGNANIADPSGGIRKVSLKDLENRMQWIVENRNVTGPVVPITRVDKQ